MYTQPRTVLDEGSTLEMNTGDEIFGELQQLVANATLARRASQDTLAEPARSAVLADQAGQIRSRLVHLTVLLALTLPLPLPLPLPGHLKRIMDGKIELRSFQDIQGTQGIVWDIRGTSVILSEHHKIADAMM
eukprot:gene13534-biopygen21572